MRDVAGDLLRDVPVSFHAPAPDQLSSKIDLTARRDLLLIYKELLHNIARHAHARAVRIDLTSRRDEIELVVSDDGCGFDSSAVRLGTGLRSMRERAERLGGRFDLTSTRGAGTTATLVVPRT
jgi:signal transduction histidine kinase